MTRLNKLFQSIRGGLKEVAFWYSVFAFFCLQAFILSGFSNLLKLWRMNPKGFDYHQIGIALGMSFFWTGLALAVIWWLFPERWKRPLLERFPSRQGPH